MAVQSYSCIQLYCGCKFNAVYSQGYSCTAQAQVRYTAYSLHCITEHAIDR
jgi:hypothetical protein